MLQTVKGLVIRTVDYREADRLITIFTEECGNVSAIAKGARSIHSRSLAATQLFCYGQFVLYKKGEFYWVKEAELLESFYGLRSSVEGMALASYICEILSDVTVAESDGELLRVSLNSLYAVSEKKAEIEKIKASFEMRTAAILGFMPEILECRNCGKKDGDFFFDIMGGSIVCAECHAEEQMSEPSVPPADGEFASIIRLISEGAKIALGYVIYCPPEKLFSFRISPEDMRIFCEAAECYLLNQLERSFRSLDFYKEVTKPLGKENPV